MAINTRNKRCSAVSVGLPWRSALPAPDGLVVQGDRQTVAKMYSGILANQAGEPVGGEDPRVRRYPRSLLSPFV